MVAAAVDDRAAFVYALGEFHVPLAPQALGRLDLARPLLVREARVGVEGVGRVGPRLEAVVRVADFFGHMAAARAERGGALRLRGEGGPFGPD